MPCLSLPFAFSDDTCASSQPQLIHPSLMLPTSGKQTLLSPSSDWRETTVLSARLHDRPLVIDSDTTMVNILQLTPKAIGRDKETSALGLRLNPPGTKLTRLGQIRLDALSLSAPRNFKTLRPYSMQEVSDAVSRSGGSPPPLTASPS